MGRTLRECAIGLLVTLILIAIAIIIAILPRVLCF